MKNIFKMKNYNVKFPALASLLALTFGASVRAQDDASYLFLSAPSVNDKYYKTKFDDLITFFKGVITKADPGDRIIIVADSPTIAAIGNRLPRKNLMEGSARDIWIRDYGVVQTHKGIFKTQFRPNYISKKDSTHIENGFLQWFNRLKIPYQRLSLKVDGGNFCHNFNSRGVITERVLTDNPQYSETQIRQIIADDMGITELAIVPEEAGDTTGHSDGMIKWLSTDTIAVNQYTNINFRNRVINRLQIAIPEVKVVLLPWNPTNRYWRDFADSTGVYVNAVTTPNAIYVPVYGLNTDAAAVAVFRKHADRRVIPVRVSPDIAIMGGAMRCLSCQVYGAPVAGGKVPGTGRPVVKFLRPGNNALVSPRRVIIGRALDADGIRDLRLTDGKRTVRPRYVASSGKWTSRFPTRPQSGKSVRLQIYGFDRTGSYQSMSRRFRIR